VFNLKIIASLLIVGCIPNSYAREADYQTAKRLTDPSYNPGRVRHIVTFKFDPSVTQTKTKEIIERFVALKNLGLRSGTPYIESIEVGKANSFEGADQGMQVGFIVTFRSEGDRNYYVGQPLIDKKFRNLYDPAHLEFKNLVGTLLATPVVPNGVFVFDFTVDGEAQ
jgi:hypothetical protein